MDRTAATSAADVAAARRLPVALRSRGYALRPETEADLPFLLTLYETTRAAELAATGWGDDQRQAFVRHQFTAQRRHYYANPAGCTFDLVARRGVPVGRLYLREDADDVAVVDIALLPDARGRGLGTALLGWVIGDAHAAHRRVTLFVEQASPALRLYTRLGFGIAGEHGLRYAMACPPPMR